MLIAFILTVSGEGSQTPPCSKILYRNGPIAMDSTGGIKYYTIQKQPPGWSIEMAF